MRESGSSDLWWLEPDFRNQGGDNLLFLDCDKSSPRIRNTHDNYILPCIGCMILWLPRFISVGISFSAEKYPDGKLVLILKSSAQYRG